MLTFTGAAFFTEAAFGLSACHESSQSDRHADLRIWNTRTLGAPAFIKLANVTAHTASIAFEKSRQELERLEHIFSLYIASSEISRLNESGYLKNASQDLINVLQTARRISTLTKGAFDITVQPLWKAADQIRQGAIPKNAQDKHWQRARALVDYREVHINNRDVSFGKEGMSISLNAIAQGYITDKIADLLIARGHKNGLVNIGEYRGFGSKNNTPWKVGIQNPNNIMGTVDVVELNDRSLATSSALGGGIGKQIYHIFDTRRAVSIHAAPCFVSASVLHPSAMIADALATAFTLMDVVEIRTCARQIGDVEGILVQADGKVIQI